MTYSLVITMLSSCAVVPTFSEDLAVEKCEVFTKSLDLKVVDVGSNILIHSFEHCDNEECLAALILGTGILMSSAIISSSIYAVGNTIHYLEKKTRCDDEATIDQEKIAFTNKMTEMGGKKVKLEALQGSNKLEASKELNEPEARLVAPEVQPES